MAMSKEVVKMETGSDSVKDSVCVPCLDVGDLREAVKFCIDCSHLVCQICVESHRRFRQLKEHKLIDISVTEDLKLFQNLSNLLFCPNHRDKKVELVCKNHDVLCCLACATVNHRGCKSVVDLGKEVSDPTQTPNAGELIKHLTAAKDYMTGIVNENERCKKACIASVDELIPKTLRELKLKFDRAFAVMEENIMREGARQKEIMVSKHTENKAKWAKSIESVNEATILLLSVQQNGSPTHMYIIANKIQKMIKIVDAAIAKQGREVQSKRISLEVGADLQNVLSSSPTKMAVLTVKDKIMRALNAYTKN